MSAVFSLPEIDALQQTVGPVRLTDLPTMSDARIVAVVAPPGPGGAELPERLAELGFIAGERVRVLARAPFGDPIAVRVGSGTFALRRVEADAVQVLPRAAGPR
jgi:ferrous iron transport protein A